MTAITLQVPNLMLLAAGGSITCLTQRCQFLLALKCFEIGQLSSGQAAAMCGMNRFDFLFEAGRQGVPVADLTEEELDKEVRNAQANSPYSAQAACFCERSSEVFDADPTSVRSPLESGYYLSDRLINRICVEANELQVREKQVVYRSFSWPGYLLTGS